MNDQERKQLRDQQFEIAQKLREDNDEKIKGMKDDGKIRRCEEDRVLLMWYVCRLNNGGCVCDDCLISDWRSWWSTYAHSSSVHSTLAMFDLEPRK